MLKRFVVAVLALAALAGPAQAATTIDFDSIAAPCCFGFVSPNTGQGPLLTFFGNVSINGGVVMENAAWAGLATTAPNLYGTSDFLALADGSFLPGAITITFATPVAGVTLDVINGFDAANFTLTAFDAGNGVIDADSMFLTAFFSGPTSVGNATVSGSGIAKLTITTDQPEGDVDFAIDTIVFNDGPAKEPAVPEQQVPGPATLALLGLGLLVGGGVARRRS
jgi:hypothetical protein